VTGTAVLAVLVVASVVARLRARINRDVGPNPFADRSETGRRPA
jgi:hypothetical protein